MWGGIGDLLKQLPGGNSSGVDPDLCADMKAYISAMLAMGGRSMHRPRSMLSLLCMENYP